jgi:hypothetical protein
VNASATSEDELNSALTAGGSEFVTITSSMLAALEGKAAAD